MDILIKKKIKVGFLGVFVFCVMCGYLGGQKLEYIENPKPTHEEKNYVRLVKVMEISGNIDDEHFMVRPWSMVVDDDGSIYAFDRLVRKIFKFDKEGRFVRTFGSVGQGPGEYGGKGDQNLLYLATDGYLYLSSTLNTKIIKYDREGNHIVDFKVPSTGHAREYSRGPFVPLTDPKNNCYLLNYADCSIDVFHAQDREFKKLYSILGNKDYNRSIVLKVRDEDLFGWRSANFMNTFYGLIGEDRVVVYLVNDSQVRIYKKDQLVRTFTIWPRKALVHYKKQITEMKEKRRKGFRLIAHMFNEFFIDSDNPDYFYLSGRRREDEGERQFQIYQFNVEGKLLKVLHIPSPCKFWLKKNNRFYGVYKENILIFKEVKADEKKSS
jgi:hypothetical protein